MEEYKNKAGECPKCGGHNLEYYPVEFNGENYYFNYICEDCKTEGREWYYGEFIGHSFYDNDKEEYIELED